MRDFICKVGSSMKNAVVWYLNLPAVQSWQYIPAPNDFMGE